MNYQTKMSSFGGRIAIVWILVVWTHIGWWDVHRSLVAATTCIPCEKGSFVTVPDLGPTIYACVRGEQKKPFVEVSSWEECSAIGDKCTSPVELTASCFFALLEGTSIDDDSQTSRDPNRPVEKEEECTCSSGDFFMSPQTSNNVYRCIRSPEGSSLEIGVVESWEACVHAGERCTNPRVVSESCLRYLIDSEERRGVPCVYKKFKSFDVGDPGASFHQTESAQSRSFSNELYMARVMSEMNHFPRLLGVDESSRAMIFDFVGHSIFNMPVPGNWEDQAEDIVRTMKSKGIAHNDIHGNNIMVDEHGVMSLIDLTWASPSPYRGILPPDLSRKQREHCNGTFDDLCFFHYAIEVDLPTLTNRVTRHILNQNQCEGFGTQASVLGCHSYVFYAKERFDRFRLAAKGEVLYANEALGLIAVKNANLLCSGAFSSSASGDANELFEYGTKYSWYSDTNRMLESYEDMLALMYGRSFITRKSSVVRDEHKDASSFDDKCHRSRRLLSLLSPAVNEGGLDADVAKKVAWEVERTIKRLQCVERGL